jgi:hypothetical protein
MTIDQRWIKGATIQGVDSLGLEVDGSWLIIGDARFWVEHELELLTDLKLMGGSQQGMILRFPDDETRTLWMLRWSRE